MVLAVDAVDDVVVDVEVDADVDVLLELDDVLVEVVVTGGE